MALGRGALGEGAAFPAVDEGADGIGGVGAHGVRVSSVRAGPATVGGESAPAFAFAGAARVFGFDELLGRCGLGWRGERPLGDRAEFV